MGSSFGQMKYKSYTRIWTNEVYFRIRFYTAISLPSSVIYFGGDISFHDSTDWVAEYKNLGWKLLGNLVTSRWGHSSIKMGTTIYAFGGRDDNSDENR